MKRLIAGMLVMLFPISAFALHRILGTPYCCVGETTTLSVPDATGGMWTSGNPLVATINTATGEVTGMSQGSVTITYALGNEHITMAFTVNGAAKAGVIEGNDFVAVGDSIKLTDQTAYGNVHYWTSYSSQVARVDCSTGVVTGVSAGTARIAFTSEGCGKATASIYMHVIPADCIYGHIYFPGGFNGKLKVSLVHVNSATNSLEAVDSVFYTCLDSVVFYQFTHVPTDSFRIKASVCDTTTYRYGFMTTYHPSQYFWFNGNLINHITNTVDGNKDILMRYGRFEH